MNLFERHKELTRQLEKLRRQIAVEEGAAQQVQKRLEDEFGCSTIKEAEKLLAKEIEREKKLAAQVEEEMAAAEQALKDFHETDWEHG